MEQDKPEKSPAEKLANRFWNKLGKLSRYNNEKTVKAWTKLTGSLLAPDASNYDEVASVIDWALEESAFWTEHIVGATTKGPMEYFTEKYEDIKQRMGAERKAVENAKKKIAKTKAAVADAGKPTYQQPQYGGFLTDDMGKEGLK